MFESAGMWIGPVLILIVTACAWLLGRKAARAVAQFRTEEHRRFERPRP